MGSGAAAPARICLFGAPDDTGNLGVSALMISTVTGLARRLPSAHLTVFDNGTGQRTSGLDVDGRPFRFERFGLWPSRRVHRAEALARFEIALRRRSRRHPGARAVLDSTAIWDVSGGDSFSDLYGPTRWDLVVRPKRAVLKAGARLILLPQTYGPFDEPGHAEVASDTLDAAEVAWARDADSFRAMSDLLGERLDPARHRRGVDVAFSLPAALPDSDLAHERSAALDRPLVGVNVSGLLLNRAHTAQQFGLTTDVRRCAKALLTWLVEERGVDVVLVPHVRGDGVESDDRASAALRQELEPGIREHVAVLPAGMGARETKGFIASLEWFCGTRMHSTIAALSSGVPAASLAYSLKTRGVFDTCGLAHNVADARSQTTEQALATLRRSFDERQADREVLARELPHVIARAEDQMDELVQDSLVSRAAVA